MRSVHRSKSLEFRKAKTAIQRKWPLGDEMQAVSDHICNRDPKQSFRHLDKEEAKQLKQWTEQKVLESKVFFTLGGELGLKFTTEALDDKSRAYARIPMPELMQVEQLATKAERLQAVADLLEKYSNSGNGCGHNPSYFQCDGSVSPFDMGDKHDPITGGKRRRQIIYEAIDRLIHAIINPSSYKSLFFRRTRQEVVKHGENIRQIRTEGRESMLGVLKVLMLAWDPRSMRAGFYKKGKFVGGIPINLIADWSGLSVSRVKTGLRLLEKQNFLFDGVQQREYCPTTEKWKGLAVIRVFKPTLFVHLGLGDRMKKERIDPAVQQAEQRYQAQLEKTPVTPQTENNKRANKETIVSFADLLDNLQVS